MATKRLKRRADTPKFADHCRDGGGRDKDALVADRHGSGYRGLGSTQQADAGGSPSRLDALIRGGGWLAFGFYRSAFKFNGPKFELFFNRLNSRLQDQLAATLRDLTVEIWAHDAPQLVNGEGA